MKIMKKRALAMLVAFLLVFQYVNYAGIISKVDAAGINENILTEMKLRYDEPPKDVIASVYKSVYDYQYTYPEARVELGDSQYLVLEYAYELKENHTYKAGDTFKFKLPSELVMVDSFNEEPLAGDPSVGHFTLDHTTGEVTMTFNEEIVGSKVAGTLSFWSYFTEASVKNKTEVLMNFGIGDPLVIKLKPSGGAPITKDGWTDKVKNPTKITWQIDINTELNKIDNAKISDIIPAGLKLINSTLAVHKLTVSTNGTKTPGDTITPQNVAYPDTNNGELVVEFGNIDSAYRITFETEITDFAAADFTNKAVLTGSNNINVSAQDIVEQDRGELLESKTSTGYKPENDHEVTWEIKYNYGEEPVAGNTLIDKFDDILNLVNGSIEIITVPDVNNDSQTGAELIENTDFTVSPVTDTVNKKNGFEIEFSPTLNSNSAYKIIYKTKANSPIYNKISVKNVVTTEGESMTDTKWLSQRFFHKNNSGINYETRTIDWEVNIENINKYDLKNLKYEDTFTDKKLKLVDGSLKITRNGATVTDSVYKLTFKPADDTNTVEGFEIEFLEDGDYNYKITYTTQYDFVDTKYASDFKFDNVGKLSWEVLESGNTVTKTTTRDSSIEANPETEHNGFKNGRYDAKEKIITWNVGINYNSKIMNDAVVTDKLTQGQTLIPASVKVQTMSVKPDGSIDSTNGVPNGVLQIENTDYKIEEPNDNNNNTLTIEFLKPITEPYYITFQTDLEGEFLDDATIYNTAEFKATGYDPMDLKAHVTVKQAGEYVHKSGTQSTSDKYLADWSIAINRGQSAVKNAKVVDIPSSKQILAHNSFKLYEAIVDKDGNVSRGVEITDPTFYSLEFLSTQDPLFKSKLEAQLSSAIAADIFSKVDGNANAGDEIFILSFEKEITTPYFLEYQSVIDAKHNDVIENKAYFEGTGVSLKENQNNSKIQIKLSGGQGTGSAYKGSLKLYKVDADDHNTKLPNATFTLKHDTNENVPVFTETTDEFGIIEFKDLPYGTYTLQETVAPDGYVIDANGTAKVTVKSTPIEITMENNKEPKGSLEISKVDADNKNTLLDGAVFELYNSSNTKVGTGTTVNGKVVFDDLKYGSYILKEITAPNGYLLNSTPITININSSVVTKEVENNKAPVGKLIITKVDASNTNAKLQGAKFELIDSTNKVVATETSDANGQIEFPNLPYGSYTLKEITAPSGYELDSTLISVTINSSSVTKEVKNNKIPLGSIKINKVDADSTTTVLKDAKFELRDSTGKTVLETKTTNTNGVVEFTGLLYGTYQLVEIDAPADYELDPTPIVITIDGTTPNVVKQVTNKKIPRGTIEITKVSSGTPAKPLTGAEFELFDQAGTSLGKATSDASGKVSFGDLLYGDYVLKETKAPQGYMLDRTAIDVKVNGPVTTKTVTNYPYIVYPPTQSGKLIITKVEKGNSSNVLAGAEFQLINSSKQVVATVTTDAQGKAEINNLLYGMYTLKEIKAPKGFTMIGSGEISINISSDNALTVTVENEAEPGPSVTPGPSATPGPSTTPGPSATPGPSTTPGPSATPGPSTTPGPSATPGPSSTPPTEKEKTTEETPITGEVDVPEKGTATPGTPPTNGKITVTPDGKWTYPPNPGYVGKANFTIIVTDEDGNEDEIFFEIEFEVVPKGGIDTGEQTPNVPKLPKTGEDSYFMLQLLGAFILVAGIALFVRRTPIRKKQ